MKRRPQFKRLPYSQVQVGEVFRFSKEGNPWMKLGDGRYNWNTGRNEGGGPYLANPETKVYVLWRP